MNVVTVYTRLYAQALAEAGKQIGRSPWTLLLPMALGTALQLLGVVIGRFPPFIAGILMALAADAAFSSYLYFVDELVARQRVGVREFKLSVGRYFWSVLNLMFVFWVAQLVLGLVLGRSAGGGGLYIALLLVAVIALNAAPETIYLRRTYGGLQTVQSSFDFLKQNWLEWFIPTLPFLVLVAAVYLLVGALAGPWVAPIVGGAFFHLMMVFRGRLFLELDGTSHRQRMFRLRNA